MKVKILVAALAAVASTGAFAVTMADSVAVCTGTAASIAIDKRATPQFIQENFNQGCSNNVYMTVGEDNVTAFASSASKKGKYYFIGNTNGGAPRAKTTATVDPANTPTPASHLTDAKNLGTS